jgi:hypothetical protein
MQGAAFGIINIARAGGNDLYDMRLHFDNIARESALAQTTAPPPAATEDDDDDKSKDSSDDANEEEDVWEATESIVTVEDDTGTLAFNQKALQRYILFCGQQTDGGMRGKMTVGGFSCESNHFNNLSRR